MTFGQRGAKEFYMHVRNGWELLRNKINSAKWTPCMTWRWCCVRDSTQLHIQQDVEITTQNRLISLMPYLNITPFSFSSPHCNRGDEHDDQARTTAEACNNQFIHTQQLFSHTLSHEMPFFLQDTLQTPGIVARCDENPHSTIAIHPLKFYYEKASFYSFALHFYKMWISWSVVKGRVSDNYNKTVGLNATTSIMLFTR